MEDLFQFENQLSNDEMLVKDTVKKFVDDEVVPIISDAYESAQFPNQLIPRLAELGLLGMTLPETYGGSEASAVAYGLACQELERGDSGIRSFVSVQNSLCMFPIFQFGSESQKQKFLPKMAKGDVIGCFGLTETDAGSDPASMRTTAKKVDGGWILNGSKMWITNAPFADIAIVWANTEKGVRGFVVEKEFKGFSTKEIKKKMLLRASSTGELIFQECFVPDENYLPGSEKGLAAPLNCLTQARFGIAWGAMGAAISCFETALAYTADRKQFEKTDCFILIDSKRFSRYVYRNCQSSIFKFTIRSIKRSKSF